MGEAESSGYFVLYPTTYEPPKKSCQTHKKKMKTDELQTMATERRVAIR